MGVDVEKVRLDAEQYFRDGKYYCSEAIVASVRDNIAPDMPASLIAAASGFPVGVGRSKCMCGAISGSVIALGYLFGRTEPTSPADPKSIKTLELAGEVQQAFRENHRVLCCSVHTKGMEMGGPEQKEQCIRFTGEMAATTAEVIARELAKES